jgi:hypothetical protein
VIELKADPSAKSYEMVVAGTGFGYCGAQLRSDETSVYFTGSSDMGATCNAVDSACGAASDVTMAATCGTSTTTFELAPIGREAGCASSSAPDGASAYPGGTGNAVVLDGTATDSVGAFGPKTPSV